MPYEMAVVPVQRTYPELVSADQPPFDQHPAAVYLFSLGSERSRRVMAQALRTVVHLLTGVDARSADFFALRWQALRYPHTAFVRARQCGHDPKV